MATTTRTYINKTVLASIADAIRDKLCITDSISPREMPEYIANIEPGISVSEMDFASDSDFLEYLDK